MFIDMAHRHPMLTGMITTEGTLHAVLAELGSPAPLHEHRHKTPARTALLLILGSSPMVEGIPAFFAAANTDSPS